MLSRELVLRIGSGSLFSETHPLYGFGKEVKYRALALLFIYICFLVSFLSSQPNSDDFSSEDERLGSLSLGVKKAG